MLASQVYTSKDQTLTRQWPIWRDGEIRAPQALVKLCQSDNLSRKGRSPKTCSKLLTFKKLFQQANYIPVAPVSCYTQRRSAIPVLHARIHPP